MTRSNWRHTTDPAEIEQVRQRRLASVLKMPYFRLVPDGGECPEHPNTEGVVYYRQRHQTVLDRFMRGQCTCDIYGASEASLRAFRDDWKVREVRR